MEDTGFPSRMDAMAGMLSHVNRPYTNDWFSKLVDEQKQIIQEAEIRLFLSMAMYADFNADKSGHKKENLKMHMTAQAMARYASEAEMPGGLARIRDKLEDINTGEQIVAGRGRLAAAYIKMGTAPGPQVAAVMAEKFENSAWDLLEPYFGVSINRQKL